MLRLAPPQDIVLTQRRDEAYKQQLGQALQESAEEFLGGQHATNLEPEMSAVGDFIYYWNTTLNRQQTLGEEYTAILPTNLVATKPQEDDQQFTKTRRRLMTVQPLSHARRYLLCWSRCLTGYLWKREFLGWSSLDRSLQTMSRSQPVATSQNSPDTSWFSKIQQDNTQNPFILWVKTVLALELDLWHQMTKMTFFARRKVAQLLIMLKYYLSKAKETFAEKVLIVDRLLGLSLRHLLRIDPSSSVNRMQVLWLPLCTLYESIPWKSLLWVLGQLNLITFYWNGRYADWHMRLLRITYVKPAMLPGRQRHNYRMIGLLIMIKLGIMTLGTIDASVQNIWDTGGDDDPSTEDPPERRRPSVNPNVAIPSAYTTNSQTLPVSNSSGASRVCSLCLSRRNHPTATKCGHIFCWNCVARWVKEHPACPVCRAPCTPQDLLCVFNYE